MLWSAAAATTSRAGRGEQGAPAFPTTDLMVGRPFRDRRRARRDGGAARTSAATFRSFVLKATAGGATAIVAHRSTPGLQSESADVLAKISGEFRAETPSRDFSAPRRLIHELQQTNNLDEATVVEFARAIATRNRSSRWPSCAGFRSRCWTGWMGGERLGPILILCNRSAGAGRPRARSSRRGSDARRFNQGLYAAYATFERLTASTAARVIKFWQAKRI